MCDRRTDQLTEGHTLLKRCENASKEINELRFGLRNHTDNLFGNPSGRLRFISTKALIEWNESLDESNSKMRGRLRPAFYFFFFDGRPPFIPSWHSCQFQLGIALFFLLTHLDFITLKSLNACSMCELEVPKLQTFLSLAVSHFWFWVAAQRGRCLV